MPNKLFPLLASLVLAVLMLVGLAACDVSLPAAQQPTPTPAPTAPPPTPTPLPRGGNLTIAIPQDIAQLQPWSPADRGQEQLIGLVYRGLMRLDPELAPQPDLAEGWQASPDGLALTFTLRSGLAWHDDTPLTAEDAVWTISSMRELSPTSALLANFQRVIAGVVAPAPNTVVLTLTERYAPLLAELAVPVLPRHLLQTQGLAEFDFWDTPVGSGPFAFEERTPGESILLAANPSFHGGEPLLDRVALVVSPDADVTRQALSDGRALLGELAPDGATTLSNTPSLTQELRFGAYPENGYFFLGFNVLEGRLFADGRLRRALALAVDVPALVAQVTGETGIPIANSAAPGSWADLTPVPTATVDLAQAAALLNEAGWVLPAEGGVRQKDGTPLTAQLFVRDDDPRRQQAAQLIAEAARQVGMDIQVQRADFESVILGLYAPPFGFDLLLGSWSNGAAHPSFADYLVYDPDDFALFHSSQINQGVQDVRPALRNFIGWRDAAYDNQAQAARQLYDIQERIAAYRQTQARVLQEHPYLYLWADRIAVVANARITTLDGPPSFDTPMYLWNIERWYLEP